MIVLFVSARESRSGKLVMNDVVAELKVGQLQERPSRQNRQISLRCGSSPTFLQLRILYHLAPCLLSVNMQGDYFATCFAEMSAVAAQRPTSPN